MKSLKDIVAISPLLGVFLIFLGMLKQIVYYKCFGIQITDYIQLSEVVTAFMYDLNIILIMLGALLLYVMFIDKLFSVKKVSTQSMEVVEKKVTGTFWGFVIFLMVTIILYILFFNYPTLGWVYAVTIIGFNPIISIARWLFKNNSLSESFKGISLLIALVLVFAVNLAIKDYLQMKQSPTTQTMIELTNKTIELSPNERVVGKTIDYLFVVDVKKGNKQIIHCSDIKRIIYE